MDEGASSYHIRTEINIHRYARAVSRRSSRNIEKLHAGDAPRPLDRGVVEIPFPALAGLGKLGTPPLANLTTNSPTLPNGVIPAHIDIPWSPTAGPHFTLFVKVNNKQ